MADFLTELLNVGIVRPAGLDAQPSIDALVERFGAALPEHLLSIWRMANTITFVSLDAHILGASEVLCLVEGGEWPNHLVEGGFVPILDDHESNYVAEVIRKPLAFRVAYLPHDDGSRLVYRDFDSFLKSLLDAHATGRLAREYFHDAQGDYPADAPRTLADQDAAFALMRSDGSHEQWNYAAQLLDACNLQEWAKLLEADHFVRRDVVTRMKQMQSPAIQELLKRDQLAFDAFALAVTEAARSSGLQVGERRHGVLQVGGKWIILETFFHRRTIRDAMPRLIAWLEDLQAGRDPHARPGHFFMN